MKTEKRTRTYEHLVYITSDGMEFDNPKAAEKHEAELLQKRQIPSKYIRFNIIDDAYVYKIESEEDLEYLASTEWDMNAYWTYKGPGWYIAFRSDGGDYPDDYNVFPVKHYLSQIDRDIDKLIELEE